MFHLKDISIISKINMLCLIICKYFVFRANNVRHRLTNASLILVKMMASVKISSTDIAVYATLNYLQVSFDIYIDFITVL